jgi:hypothetical protein
MSGTYDDLRWGVLHQMTLSNNADAAIGSARAAAVVLARKTFMENVTVKDFNLEVVVGATCTGTGGVATEVYTLIIGKSAAGTGAVSAIGTATVGTGGAADDSVVDGTVTETNFSSGDDIVFQASIGTSLGDNSLVARANISYVERYVSA